MSRRPPSSKDRTSWIVAKQLLERLNWALGTLDEQDMDIIRLRFGLRNEEPMTRAEIGEIYGISRKQVRQIETRAMTQLRNPWLSQYLREFLDSDDDGFLTSAIRHTRMTDISTAPVGIPILVFCERHGCSSPQLGKRCSYCPCQRPPYAGSGRLSIYCSRACRQAAYRERRRTTTDS